MLWQHGLVTSESPDLERLATDFAAARDELARLRRRLPEVQSEIARLRPQVIDALVDDIKHGRRSQAEISKLTGYTTERIRQLCRAAGVEAA
ncbi:hypothetical protein [Pseudosporangium ferrugineum]|uniref:Uncharacterized protein n=1 Tax=Pseudosporangium ferrugineum TaxID=439699 RepID=A0A2T0RSC0_9ACTN|nr:hypothetical protein [Pseudosporangium ferrugineum]PRY24017.1 hypothetical protein CLV70_114150 [Pseudosporangium ferrugineum]